MIQLHIMHAHPPTHNIIIPSVYTVTYIALNIKSIESYCQGFFLGDKKDKLLSLEPGLGDELVTELDNQLKPCSNILKRLFPALLLLIDSHSTHTQVTPKLASKIDYYNESIKLAAHAIYIAVTICHWKANMPGGYHGCSVNFIICIAMLLHSVSHVLV